MEVRRTTAGTLAAAFNLVLVSVTGIILIGNEWVSDAPSRLWVALGLGLLVWGAIIASALLRPVILALDDEGLAVRGVFGTRRIAWNALHWMDMDRSARFGMFAATAPDGRMRYVGVSKRHWPEGTLEKLKAEVLSRRPDLPLNNPDAVKEAT